jgi:hypothetical protein
MWGVIERIIIKREFFKTEGVRMGKTIPYMQPKIEVIDEESRIVADEEK